MATLAQSLAQLKTSIEEKKLFKSESSQLYPDLKFADLSKLSKTLTLVSDKELKDLIHLKEGLGKDINSFSRSLRDLKAKYKDVEKKLSDKKKTVSVELVFNDIKKIISTLPIVHIEFVEPAVTVFTTAILKKGKSIIGIYRIWIDWTRPDFANATRIINIYKTYGNYDHPCIDNGSVCQGNASETFKKHYRAGEIYELIEAIVGFLISKDVRSGYVNRWSTWLSSARRVKKREFESEVSASRQPLNIDSQAIEQFDLTKVENLFLDNPPDFLLNFIRR